MISKNRKTEWARTSFMRAAVLLPTLLLLSGCITAWTDFLASEKPAKEPMAQSSTQAIPQEPPEPIIEMAEPEPIDIAPPAEVIEDLFEPGVWTNLFDGKTLDGWKETDFGGEDDVYVEDGRIILKIGAAMLSGITRTRPVPRMNYEATLEAMRVDGYDFFCGFTFPVKEDCCSLIVGGWGGSLVGISSLDNMDASENETTMAMEFEKGQWYRIRVRVTEGRIQAWIDDKEIINVEPGQRQISVRSEVEESQPFGVAAWNTKSALRDIRVRLLEPGELEKE